MLGIGWETISRVGVQYISWCVFAVTFGFLYYENRAQKINEIQSQINEEREIKRQEEVLVSLKMEIIILIRNRYDREEMPSLIDH